MMDDIHKGLVYVGEIVRLEKIENADFIESATVMCGEGGKWSGIVKKDQEVGTKCIVYLPDALIPESHEMNFMKASNWRVRMRRFRGAPSEVLIMPYDMELDDMPVGTDITKLVGVKKYVKEIPAHLQGKAKGDFPTFIPKTDELNYQRYMHLADDLHGRPYYITLKYDGSSTTAYKYKGNFEVCSRNYILEDDGNVYYQVAKKYDLKNKLPEGIALQWETCGPKIQWNPLGLEHVDGFAFSAHNIRENRYLNYYELLNLCGQLNFPCCETVESGESFDKDNIYNAQGVKYLNGKFAEGIVIRSKQSFGNAPISFKMINLDYDN